VPTVEISGGEVGGNVHRAPRVGNSGVDSASGT